MFVRGSLTGADGHTIAGARLYFDGVPTSQSTILPVYASGPPNAESDVDGEFRALVYSTFSPGALVLRAAVVQPGLPDTVRITVGSATFRGEHEQPDTVAVTLRLPERRR